MTSKAESTEIREPDFLEDEITRTFERIGEPDMYFTFRNMKNLPWGDAKKFRSSMAKLAKSNPDDDGAEEVNANLKRVVVRWNVTRSGTDEVLPIPSEDNYDVVNEVRVRHIDFMIFCIQELDATDPLADILMQSVPN
jgi:hypothetical protein